MDLAPGAMLEHYRLAEKIGEGGMGVVWRAQDMTLGRDVAIKILPEIFAGDAERLARFEREAKVLASLNHPNIAAVYGLHQAGGCRFLVMELVPGEDYARRVKSGPLSIDEALRVAGQVAEALEAAHALGVVHRDLKPANIKSEADGRVKVLDFGLAKALEGDGPSGDLSMSPTLTHRATQAGVILGTAAYMSPEQARGRSVDRRADVWAFGVVLYELLTGQRLFEGETVSDTLAGVLKTEPDWSALPPATPAPIRRLLRRCLQKDPRRRLRDIGDAGLEIEQALAGPAPEDAVPAPAVVAAAAPAAGGSRRLILGVGLVAVLAAAAAGMMAGRSGGAGVTAPPLRKYEIEVANLDVDGAHRPVISPDGRQLIYYTVGKMWLRNLADLEAREVEAGDKSTYPFWSADSATIGFFRDGRIWKLSIAGGQATAICSLPGQIAGGAGGAWRADGSLVFSLATGPLYEVPPRGGDPRPLLEPREGLETDFHEPSLLPDGRSLVFAVHGKEGIDSIETLVDGKRTVLLQMKSHSFAHPAWSPTGHLLYRRFGTGSGLWAAPFSKETQELAGEPFLAAADAALPSVANDGTLALQYGQLGRRRLVWIDRSGQITATVGQPQEGMQNVRLSPDGTRVAVSAQEAENRDIWVHDLERGTKTRLTRATGPDFGPDWFPSGGRLAFGRATGAGPPEIFFLAADGTGEEERVTTGGNVNVSPDGKFLAHTLGAPAEADLMVFPLEGDRKPSERVRTPFGETRPQISPDGRFLAYQSDESGRPEVYVRSFPSGAGRWQVSANGGLRPRWSRKGGELFFVAGDDLMVVPVQTEPTLELGTATRLFSGRALNLADMSDYDVSPDGRRILGVQREADAVLPRVTIVQSWFREFAPGP